MLVALHYIYAILSAMDYRTSLKVLKPLHNFFIGIDSDGCVFDSMEIKQKEFFIPNALKYFNLSEISGILSETWEFVNLYSIHRGGNRFISLIKVFELLKERYESKNEGILLPDLSSLRQWIECETRLGNDSLRKYFEKNFNSDLEKVLKWTEAVNNDINERLRNIPPFPNAAKAIKEISQIADLVIISQTPLDALDREWEEHDLKKYIQAIAAQEHGTKTEHLALAAKEKFPDNRILMIGDAIGDLIAAKNNGVLFYPIAPGAENSSWERFLKEGFSKFTDGSYQGSYEEKLINEFRQILPDKPDWL